MKLLDNDSINYMFENNISLVNDYFITPDVEEEMKVAEIIHNKKAPQEISPLIYYSGFDRALYLRCYFDALNSYKKRYFLTMRGFGDVSIVAAVATLIQLKKEAPAILPLPGFEENIEVYTGDRHLTKVLKEKFGQAIKLFDKSDINKLIAPKKPG